MAATKRNAAPVARDGASDRVLAEQRDSQKPSSGSADVQAAQHLYDGLQHVGTIVELSGCGWEAANASGRVIGSFPNPRAARDAILAARRGPAR